MATADVYAPYIGGRGDLSYTVADPSISYPDQNDITTLGRTYLPGIYAKELTGLELASSGLVTLTLNDTRSLNIVRDDPTTTISINTLGTDSFAVNTQGTMDHYSAGDMGITTDGTLTTTAGNGMVYDITGSYKVDVNNGSMVMNMDSDTNTYSLSSVNDLNTTAGNNTTMKTTNDFFIESKTTDETVNHSIKLDSANNTVDLNTTGEYNFFIDQKQLVNINPDAMHLYGNLNIEGVINATKSIVHNRLEVQDKILSLGATSNYLDSVGTGTINYDDDGVVNNGAGISIQGMPTDAVIPDGLQEQDVAHLYEKSLKWNVNANGVTALGGTDIEGESQWVLKGGAFYLNNVRTDPSTGEKTSETSFGLRINERDEMELIKISDASGSKVVKRVARFGLTL
jgi:hypothetical protein